jgi:hypothetical protein
MICCENIWVLYMSYNPEKEKEIDSDDGLDAAVHYATMEELDKDYISDVEKSVPGDEKEEEEYKYDFEDEEEEYKDDFEDDFVTPIVLPPPPPGRKKFTPRYTIPTRSTTEKIRRKPTEKNNKPFKFGGKTRRQKKKSVRKMESVVFSFLPRTSRKKCRRNRKTRKARK